MTVAVGIILAIGGSESAQACSVCFGAAGVENSDAAGLNAGVAVLFVALAVIEISLARLFWKLLRRAQSCSGSCS